jgi:esterase/lipase superfamily enzyme
MMPTPNVLLEPNRDFYSELPEELKSTEVQLLYVTDRAPETDQNGELHYGYERSASLGFGTAVVDLGVNLSWDELLEASRAQKRLKPVRLELEDVTEIARGPMTPLPFREIDGRIVEEPERVAERRNSIEVFHRALARRLALTPRKEVFIYVHGYHNNFDDAAFAMAELWHFLGRIGVPLIYTWPAGYPGLFGYTYDRESSEFTVYHLRSLLQILAEFPEVERVHIIAHSRGTDVAVAALREVTIGARAAGIDPKERFKVRNLILAAPDLDLQVATQRIVGDKLPLSVHRFTIYTSPEDKAIGFATKLFASPRGRLGTFGEEQLSPRLEGVMSYSNANLAVVNFESASDILFSTGQGYGHSYFRDAPTVASDVVLTLRDDLDPGAPGRPLLPLGHHFWRIPQGYPELEAGQ